ncbi:hypothetical protein BS47DRAFT_1466102 [Hydnum rufescens UP504]|uniref:Enoyl-CoA hydratase n=1 Tax=Hydnum rufescens UP504 TaxID=1448309 RepID=A0A9P6AWN1_9AGAM|nr:hypothetical protein BS47DRAFT_1466102 [Hydnum rufescens UP504]
MYSRLRLVLRATPALLRLPRAARTLSTISSYSNITATRPDPSVALITLNRPKALNALNAALMVELNQALGEADVDDSVGAIIITGSEKAFAAGADIKEMKDMEFSDAYRNDFLANWSRISQIRKPVIAAVIGLMCDIILASPSAVFGQPEISLGIIPGGGALEAEKWGLVSRVVSEGEGEVVKESLAVARKIAEKGRLAVLAAKETVNAAYELGLAQGIRFERRVFHSLFASNDQKEGMSAFAQKRKAVFTNS